MPGKSSKHQHRFASAFLFTWFHRYAWIFYFLFSPCLKKSPKNSACASFGFIPLERINIKNRDHEQLTQNPYFEQLANSPIWLLDCGWGSTKMGSHVFLNVYISRLTNSENFTISISEMIGIRQQKYPDLWHYPNYGSSSIRSQIGCSQGAKKNKASFDKCTKNTTNTQIESTCLEFWSNVNVPQNHLKI